jgi:hypothetical protein
MDARVVGAQRDHVGARAHPAVLPVARIDTRRASGASGPQERAPKHRFETKLVVECDGHDFQPIQGASRAGPRSRRGAPDVGGSGSAVHGRRHELIETALPLSRSTPRWHRRGQTVVGSGPASPRVASRSHSQRWCGCCPSAGRRTAGSRGAPRSPMARPLPIRGSARTRGPRARLGCQPRQKVSYNRPLWLMRR